MTARAGSALKGGFVVLGGLVARVARFLLVSRRSRDGLLWRMVWLRFVSRTYDRPGGAEKLTVMPYILAGFEDGDRGGNPQGSRTAIGP